MNDKILVPIKIEALIVSDSIAEDPEYKWKSFPVDYEALYTRMGINVEPGNVQNLDRGGFWKKGIHLHWALPAALCSGICEDKGTTFPPVPNRWLVVRTHFENNKPVTKKWLLESDYIGSNGSNPWVVQQPDGSFSPLYRIGKITVLENWQEEEKQSEIPLTAVGPGNPAFAAVYEHSKNVFGFWDDLVQLERKAMVFSYLITGWYSDEAIDPMLRANGAMAKSLKQKWSIENKDIPEDWSGEVLCHGMLHSVDWNPDSAYLLPVRGAEVNTGVGFTSVEAKSAQLARQTGAAEKLLNAYLLDGLKDVTDAIAIENLAHNQTFGAHDGGDLWEIKRKETDGKNAKEKAAVITFPDPILNKGISVVFRELNQAQQLADRLLQEKKSLMVEFRALCDKMIKNEKGDSEAERSIGKQLLLNRDQLRQEIDELNRRIAEQLREVIKLEKFINDMPSFKLTDTNKDPFELIKKKMPSFWQSNNPAVLFSGPGITDSGKYKKSGEDDRLSCRMPGKIISGISIKDDKAANPKIITAREVTLSLKQQGSLEKNIDVITRLYQEAILMDPDWGMIWGRQYYNNGDGNKLNAQHLGKYIANIWRQPQADPDGKLQELIDIDGSAIAHTTWSDASLAQMQEMRGIQKWKHPWTPLYLIWHLKFFPSYKMENGQWLYREEDWGWENKRYYYKGGAPDLANGIEYSGKVLLNDLMGRLLQKKLPENKDIGWHISQALSSFSNALLMRDQCIQIPLLRFANDQNRTLVVDEQFSDYLTGDNYFFPAVDQQLNGADNFFPVRAGHVQFSGLWITDAFGQVKEIIETDDKGNRIQSGMMQIAESMVGKNIPGLVELPPRIIQPARLSMRWCAGQLPEPEEANGDPATTPVCGWILPDHFNQSLGIYEESGKKCGELKIKNSEGKLLLQWAAPPGQKTASTPEEAISNRYLLAFVKGLFSRDAAGAVLGSLLKLCNDRALFFAASTAQQPPGVAGLIGQPLALVLASLQLELQGIPAQPQSYEHKINEASIINAPGLAQFAFPVSMGDTRNSRDGLIGYFINDSESGFNKMHIAFGMDEPADAYFTKEDAKLKFIRGQSSVMTLLMDPRGGVHADTAILPSKFIDLPAVYVEKQLKCLELDLLVAPFLGVADSPFIPLGIEPESRWVLTRKDKNTWNQINLEKQTPMLLGSLNGQQVQEGWLTLKPSDPGA